MTELKFDEYQEKSQHTAIYLDKVKEKYPDLPEEIYKILGISYCGNGLGEAGEIQGKIKKIIRDAGGDITDEVKQAIAKEYGDLLWYVAMGCNEFGISLGDVAQANLDKLLSRKERGVIGGNGDER